MGTTAPAPTAPLTLEEKITKASSEAAQIAEIFSPAVGEAIQAGVAAEPIIAAMIHLFAGLFRHHTSK